ncbi:MAG: DUF4249 domain-containing protein [Bacteroidales bacterium]|nr:DUF4249 domain-containing protein [Bacteroidales bacterium]
MKKRVFPFILATIMTLGFTSCEKIIEFNGDVTEPYLVVISKPQADSTWMLRVSQSRFFLSNAEVPAINNAQVIVAVNGNESTATSEGNGMYNTGIVPQPGDSLSIRVISPHLGEVSAGCRIPQRPVVSDFTIEYDTTIYENSWTNIHDSVVINRYVEGNINLHFKLHDPANERNYYMVRLATKTWGSWSYRYITIEDNILFDIDATNEVFDLYEEEDNNGTAISFTDERINGNAHPITISLYIGHVSPNTYFDTPDQELELYPTRIEVYAISRDQYLYNKTINAAENYDGFMQVISEPVQVHTNIEGGIGILGASSKVVINVFE